MGSIEEPVKQQQPQQQQQLYGKIDHPIHEENPEPYDKHALAYGKAPEHMFTNIVSRTYPLDDIREKVFGLSNDDDNQRSREYLRQHGYTAVKHRTALQSAPLSGSVADFLDHKNIYQIYHPELTDLLKKVTGCKEVFFDTSIVRAPTDLPPLFKDEDWKREEEATKTKMHLSRPARVIRTPHNDYNGRGCRAALRKWSQDVIAHAEARGIIEAEDRIAAPLSAYEKDSEAKIEELYDGPRYATFSVWRPLKKVTRDPLAMCSYNAAWSDSDLIIDAHEIKAAGDNGDWFREIPSLRVRKDMVEKPDVPREGGMRLEYLSNMDVDEVLILKLFDTASMDGQAKVSGESPGCFHASPDIGEAAFGDPRESIDCRVFCFW